MKNWSKLSEKKKAKDVNIKPKEVLPTSPIKTFAGDQLKARKASSEPERETRGKGLSSKKDKEKKLTKKQDPTKPSKPSMKLTRLIEPVMKKINIK